MIGTFGFFPIQGIYFVTENLTKTNQLHHVQDTKNFITAEDAKEHAKPVVRNAVYQCWTMPLATINNFHHLRMIHDEGNTDS